MPRQWLATTVLIFGLSALGQSKPAELSSKTDSQSAKYTLTLSAATNPVPLTGPLNVTLTATNISKSPVFWEVYRSDTQFMGFRFLLTKNGREVETTFYHRVLTGRQRPDDPTEVWSGSSILIPEAPGIILSETIDLKKLYVVTEPGEYKLEVSRSEDGDKGVVRSNSLVLAITP